MKCSCSFDDLSTRELEVLEIVAQDKTDREIARAMGIAERTVRAHVGRIIVKLGVASRVGAAVAYTARRFGACGCLGRLSGSGPSLVPALAAPAMAW